MRRVLIFGATSAIVEATARRFADAGDALFLVGRSESRLQAVADDLLVRGAARTEIAVLDALDFERQEQVVAAAADFLGGIDMVLIGYGTLPDQQAAEADAELVRQSLEINAVSTLCLMTRLANELERAGSGTMAVISSVAGDRGRRSNYVYGAAKTSIDHFADGLRCRFAGSNVRIVTIKPGFVDTPMTAEFRKGFLWASPKAVAAGIHSAMLRGREVVYVPWFWRWIMFAIRIIPGWLFRRLPL